MRNICVDEEKLAVEEREVSDPQKRAQWQAHPENKKRRQDHQIL